MKTAGEAAKQARDAERADVEQKTAELSHLRAEMRTLHTRIAPLESLLKQRDGALSERAERIEQLTAETQSLATQIEGLQSTLRQRGERIAVLERQIATPAPAADDSHADELERLLATANEERQQGARRLPPDH